MSWVNTEEPTKKWKGSTPVKCDVCRDKIKDIFVDGKTSMRGLWANMCDPCHQSIGVGLGLGRGQRYELRE